MKVYTKVVLNIRTLEVVEEEYYFDPDDGTITELKGGGGGGSGKVDYPAYLKMIHSYWLADADPATVESTGADAEAITASVSDAIGTALGANPWTGVTAYDPATPLAAMITGISTFQTVVDSLQEADEISFDVAAFGDLVDDRVQTGVMPRFQRGMQNINAVNTSAFPIGMAIIEGMATRDVTKFASGLATEKFRSVLGAHQAIMQATIEAKRMDIIANREEKLDQTDLDNYEAIWSLDVWQSAANVLAAIGGGTAVPPGTKTMSKGQSALAGAAAGASVGAAFGPYGAGIGAAIGAYAGYTSA